MGSFDDGFGTILLARMVGGKKAREIGYLCEQYDAQEALRMGLVNKAVPPDQPSAVVAAWGKRMPSMSPTALRFLKASFNADADRVYGIPAIAHGATRPFYGTEEGQVGRGAWKAKREPDFGKFRRTPWQERMDSGWIRVSLTVKEIPMQITDTLKAARELEQSGLPRSQAEALAQQQERTAQELVANIRLSFAPDFAAIHAEFAAIRAEFGTIRGEFGTIRAEFGTIRAEMNSLKTGLQAEFREALRDQLFKFTVMLFSGLGLTIAALSLIYAMFRN